MNRQPLGLATLALSLGATTSVSNGQPHQSDPGDGPTVWGPMLRGKRFM